MDSTSDSSVSFTETETRHDEMHSTIEDWIEELLEHVDDAQASEEFQEWLDVQSRFHEYSYRNTLLIKRQCPEATKVAGYRTWQEKFDRQVKGGEDAIWIWAPITAKQCPACGNSPSYHENSDCEYDETPSEEWSEGLVGFKPVPVFDISQTEGEPLPELDTAAVGDAEDLLPNVLAAAETLGIDASIVPASEWSYGSAKGICEFASGASKQPIVKAKAGVNRADLVVTLLHEYAHALLHNGVGDEAEREKREVEAEAVAYLCGRYFELDVSGSTFYLAAWRDEETTTITNRLERIRSTAITIVDRIDAVEEANSEPTEMPALCTDN